MKQLSAILLVYLSLGVVCFLAIQILEKIKQKKGSSNEVCEKKI